MNTRVLDRRPAGALGRMGVVAGVHVAVIYLVAVGLGVAPGLDIPERIQGTIVDEKPIIDEFPPMPTPKIEDPIRVQVQEPVAPPAERDTSTDTIDAEAVPDPVPLPPVETIPQSVLIGVRPDARHPLTRPPYPSEAIRRELQGAVEIEVFVLPNGRVGDARIFKSTGHAVLDQAALDEARRRWRLLPATRDGVPYAQWHKFRVVFDLRDR